MSRGSRKSELSPSATGGSNIDLGKNDGVDMGRKTEPSVTSGGLGITSEITNIGGLSVTVGGSVDVSPINLGINYDPSENSVSVASGAEIPGGLLGVFGGVTIDLNTGEVTGGSLGGEALGLGVNVSSSKNGGLGIEVTVQFGPIEISLGFGFPPEEKRTPTSKPKPPPSGNNPQGFETSKQCFGGSYVLIGTAFSFSDITDRIYPLEDALAKMDLFSERKSNYSESYEDAFADREFGTNKWYKSLKTTKRNSRVGQWQWISNSNNNYYGSPGIIFRHDAIAIVNHS